MKDKHFQQLERRIADGPFHYIVFYGVLGWGLPTGVLFAAFKYWSHDYNIRPESIFSSIIVFAIMGIPFGYSTWLSTKNRYYKEKAKRQQENSSTTEK